MCQAFSAGCSGKVSSRIPEILEPGAAAFYGVRPDWLHLWWQAKVERRDWYYIDNAYFDGARERMFRVERKRLQHDGSGHSDGKRLSKLGLHVKPWRTDGTKVLVCAQSPEFMATVAQAPTWLEDTLTRLRELTDRPIAVRHKGDQVPFHWALSDAWIVVTWSSAAAVQALIAGVPVVCAPECAAAPFATAIENIERPKRLFGREAWAAVLADHQYTLDEMRSGQAWRALSA